MEIIKRSRLMIAWEFIFGANGSKDKHEKYVKAVECLDKATITVDSIGKEESPVK